MKRTSPMPRDLPCTVHRMEPHDLGCSPADLRFPVPSGYSLLTATRANSSLQRPHLQKESLTSQHSDVQELPHPAWHPGAKPPATSGQQGSPEASPAFLEPFKVDRS